MLRPGSVDSSLELYGYEAAKYDAATKQLAEMEHEEDIEAVLVSVSGAANLQRAFPNFCLDTREFLQQLIRRSHDCGRAFFFGAATMLRANR